MMAYIQNDNAISMHSIPRFGHSEHLTDLASENPEERDDYMQGVRAFPIFLCLMCATWVILLLYLKVGCGLDRVGCAAGGEVINVVNLRKSGVRRWERHRRVLRSLKLQNLFLLCAIVLTSFSFVAINRGLDPALSSFDETAIVAGEVESIASQGLQIAKSLAYLHRNQLQKYPRMGVETLCPNYFSDDDLVQSNAAFWVDRLNIVATSARVTNSMYMLESSIYQDDAVNKTIRGLNQVTSATKRVEGLVLKSHDANWVFKIFLLVINSLNLLLMLAVIFAKNRVVSEPLQAIVGHALVPCFFVVLAGTVVATGVVIGVAAMNADYCTGGVEPGSPVGTFQDFAMEHGFYYGGPVHQSLEYFASIDCEDQQETNPLTFLAQTRSIVRGSASSLNSMLGELQKVNVPSLSTGCGLNVQTTNTTLFKLSKTLESLADELHAATILTNCSSIQPTMESLVYGPACTESINALTWLLTSLLVIIITGFVMLSVRAALFNPFVPAPKKKRREKEFKQYKDYMEQYGYNTSNWQIDPNKPQRLPAPNEEHQKFLDDAGTSVLAVGPHERNGPESPAFLSTQMEEGFITSFGSPVPTPTAPPMSEDDNSAGLAFVSPTLSALSSATAPPMSEEDKKGQDGDDNSCYSTDSDDSSINPPGSVVSGMASSLRVVAARVFSVRRKASEDEGPADGILATPSDLSSISHSVQNKSGSFMTPMKHPTFIRPKSLLGDLDVSLQADEIEPLSPPSADSDDAVNNAPQKSLKTLGRTNGSLRLGSSSKKKKKDKEQPRDMMYVEQRQSKEPRRQKETP